jgi:ribosomal protein L37AE/L43A
MRIEQRVPCPRCGHGRVVQRSRETYICFQCRHTWGHLVETHDVLRGWPAELRERMQIYKRAVAEGFYSDYP